MKHMCPQDCDLVLQFHRSSVIAALSRDSLFRCMCPDRRPVHLLQSPAELGKKSEQPQYNNDEHECRIRAIAS